MSESEIDTTDAPRDEDDWYSEAEYRGALVDAAPRISPLQRRMLVAHAEAPDRMLSVRQLAAAGGYNKPRVTYTRYGRLGYLLAEALGHEGKMKVWTYMIGDGWRTVEPEHEVYLAHHRTEVFRTGSSR